MRCPSKQQAAIATNEKEFASVISMANQNKFALLLQRVTSVYCTQFDPPRSRNKPGLPRLMAVTSHLCLQQNKVNAQNNINSQQQANYTLMVAEIMAINQRISFKCCRLLDNDLVI